MLAMCHTKSLFAKLHQIAFSARIEDAFAKVSNNFQFSGSWWNKSYTVYATCHSCTTDCHVPWLSSNVRYIGNMLKAITHWIITLLRSAIVVLLV